MSEVLLTGGTIHTDSAVATASVTHVPPPNMAVATKNELSRFGVKEDDLLYMTNPLVFEGINGNGHEFTAAELQANYQTMVGTPLDLDHSKSVLHIVGKNYGSSYETVNGVGVMMVDTYVYANLFPAISAGIVDGVITGMSMEVKYKSATRRVTPERTILQLHGCTFVGNALVRFPAEELALIDKIRTTASRSTGVSTREVELAIAMAVATYQHKKRYR